LAREPIFNAPFSVVAVMVVLIAVHGALWLLPPDQQMTADLSLAFNPARYGDQDIFIPGGRSAAVYSFVTHQLVHGDFTHLLVNGAWLFAFGSAIAARIKTARFLTFGVLCGIAGALLYLVMRFGEDVPMVGASGAISGLMGGAFRFFFVSLDRGGLGQFRQDPLAVPRMSIRQALADSRVRFAIGIWVAVNFIMALAAPWFTGHAGIAWEAHLGGFFFGFLTFQFFDRGVPLEDSPPPETVPRV
jgi:membrane associated rhomboid family serine protease